MRTVMWSMYTEDVAKLLGVPIKYSEREAIKKETHSKLRQFFCLHSVIQAYTDQAMCLFCRKPFPMPVNEYGSDGPHLNGQKYVPSTEI